MGGNISLQLDGVFYDDQYLEVSNGAGTLQEAYGTHNARISWWGMDEKFRITAWVRNYTDEEYKGYALDLGILGATATYAPPRMYGLTAGYHF
ncbi:MAG: TonB-dependent receptor [Gammaproteobacteria bacterium]|nr:TonB-dependent receptor [Gammaproteobacteria bacterium]